MSVNAPTIPNLFMTWKELYDRSEEFWSKPIQELLGTETFVAGLSAVRENTLSQQKLSRENLESTWEALRLPSKSDLSRLAGQVVTLENKIEDATDRLDALESKLDAILAAVQAIPARTAAPLAATPELAIPDAIKAEPVGAGNGNDGGKRRNK